MYFDIPISDFDEILDRTPTVWESLRGAHIFMTGGTGFFGRWLLGSVLRANERLSTNIELTVMTRNSANFIARFPDANNPKIKFHLGDIRHSIFPTNEFSHILHLATDPGFLPADQHLQIADGIITGTRRVLDFAVHQAKAKRFLYCSTGAVYGPATDGATSISEDYGVGPSPSEFGSLFGNAKRMSEQLCTLYHHQFGLETKIARCFAFVGPHLPISYYAIGNFIRDACEGKGIKIRGDGRPVRSYLYAGDLTVWLWRILVDGQSNRPYNVGSDQAFSIKELAQITQDIVSPGLSIDIACKEEKHPGRSYYVPSVQRARDELGLDVWTSLPDAIARTAKWLKQAEREPSKPDVRPESPKTFVVDIDGVLASITPKNDYRLAQPINNNINSINLLYEAGHKIILFTARGTMTGIDWRETTERQMKKWGVKHHELHLGKPAADYYIDDKSLPLEALHYIGQ